jgi:membrane peptidoglycan carboxypeptidase
MAFRPSAIASGIRRIFLVIGVSALCGILIAGLALPVMGALGLGARESADWFRNMDLEFEAGELAETSRVRDADGRRLATFFDENRRYVDLEDISDNMIDAILAIEDDRFFERGPIDFQGTLRAAVRNVEAGSTQGGGSTLTQQYVKQVRLLQAESEEERLEVLASQGVEGYRRKLEELRMAISVEQEFTKEEILERYLNIAYFGNRAYGVQAAARTYFSTSASDLTVEQAATLAGLVQSPNQYAPTENPEAALGRRNVVLGRMAETGRISDAEAAEARQTDLELDTTTTTNGCVSAWAGYFCDYVFNELLQMEELGETREERRDAVYQGGLTIETTLDRDAQRAADEAVSDWVAATDEAVASLASVEPGTGHIKALSNSREYGVEGDGVSNVNFAVDRDMGGSVGMQPGSAYKTFFLAAAINQGISLNTSFDSPGQMSLPVNSFANCDGTIRSTETWRPRNSTGNGEFNLRTATERSVNTYYAQLAQQTGLCEPLTLAEEIGAGRADGNDLLPYPASVLGANEVSPLGMAEAYATFANRGVHCESTAILTVKDRHGEVIVDNTEPNCERVLEEPVADTVNMVLEGVVHNSGATGTRMQLEGGRRSAGKTGTTNNSIAVWWVGYVPQLSTAVAVGDVDGDPNDASKLRSLRGMTFNGQRIDPCGGCIPGPIWKQMMDKTLEGQSNQSFDEPDGSVIQGISTTVPDVRGMNADDAIETLEDAGFTAAVTSRVDSDLPEGRVVRSDPGAGSEAPSGINIRLFVSNGNPPGNNDDDDDDDEDDREFRIPENDPPSPPPPPDNDDDDDDDDGWRD